MKSRYPSTGLKVLCGLFGLSRQAYYHAIKQKKKEDEKSKLMIEKVKKIREDLPGTGTRRLHYLTISYRKKHAIKIGRDKLHEVLREANMHISFRKRRTRTTYSEHGYKRYKNLTEGLEVTGINQLYVSDITYIPIGTRYAYLNLVTDAFSRKIIGWHLHKSLHAEGTIKALKVALEQKDKQPGKEPLPYQLIHHSDRGIQYCCNEHIKILKDNQILISMTNNPDPLENALAERMHRTLKEEFNLEKGFPTFEQAEQAVARTIYIYNHKYPHGSLGYLTPNQVHRGRKPGKKKWKKYPRKANQAMTDAMVA